MNWAPNYTIKPTDIYGIMSYASIITSSPAYGQYSVDSNVYGDIIQYPNATEFYIQIKSCGRGLEYSGTAQGCVPCQPGYYKGGPGNVLCMQCPAGEYSAAGSGECSLCNAGFSTVGLPAQGTCTPCSPGSYSPVPTTEDPNANCILCNYGQYQNESQQMTCILCGIGFYADSLGTANCTICPEGERNEGPGLENVNACAPAGGAIPLGLIIGLAVTCAGLMALVAFLIWYKRYKRNEEDLELGEKIEELKSQYAKQKDQVKEFSEQLSLIKQERKDAEEPELTGTGIYEKTNTVKEVDVVYLERPDDGRDARLNQRERQLAEKERIINEKLKLLEQQAQTIQDQLNSLMMQKEQKKTKKNSREKCW